MKVLLIAACCVLVGVALIIIRAQRRKRKPSYKYYSSTRSNRLTAAVIPLFFLLAAAMAAFYAFGHGGKAKVSEPAATTSSVSVPAHLAATTTASKPLKQPKPSKQAATTATATTTAASKLQPASKARTKPAAKKKAVRHHKATTVRYVQLYPSHSGCGGIAFLTKPRYSGGRYMFRLGTVVRLKPVACAHWRFAGWGAKQTKHASAVRCKKLVCRFAIRQPRLAKAVFVPVPVVQQRSPAAPVTTPVAPVTHTVVTAAPSKPQPDPAPVVTRPPAHTTIVKKKTKPPTVTLPPATSTVPSFP